MKSEVKVLAQNKKARHDYFIEDNIETGIVLCGTEVKSIRLGNVNLRDAYVSVKSNEAYIIGMHISPYEKGNIFNQDPIRERKLLLHKREIKKLGELVSQKGCTLIPLSLYLKNGLVKLDLAVAKGKKLYDKRESIKQRDVKRDLDRHYKN